MTTSSKQDFLGIAAAGSALAPIKFGLGGVPLGNEFEVVSDEDAHETLEVAWNAGVRYYDVSPRPNLGQLSLSFEFRFQTPLFYAKSTNVI